MASVIRIARTFSFTSCTRTNIQPFITAITVVTSVPSSLSGAGSSSVSPITDFRLRYNDTAAAAVKAASDKALEAKQYWEASSKKVILK